MSLHINEAGSVRHCLNCIHESGCKDPATPWWELAKDGCAAFQPKEGGAVFALVRSDGLGRCSVENTCFSFSEAEAEHILGLPESEVYVAGRLGDSDVYRSTDWYIDGPYASILEAHERIEG